MESIKVSSQRIFYAVAIFIMAVALVLPAIVSAATVTERSIEMTSSSKAAQDVTYTVNFTSVGTAAAFVVDFCANTPLIGQSCTAPDGMDVSGATAVTAGFTVNETNSTANHLVVDGTVAATTGISVEFSGITNPADAGTIYARIVTFGTTGNAASATPTSLTGKVDEGGVALAITDSIGVSGVVLETLMFCVAGAAIDENCANITVPPVLVLGTEVGGVTALQPGQVSDGSVFTQISTNAVSGAVIYLKSNAEGCGGLLRAGDLEECDIKPALDQGVDDNNARFGVMINAATTTGDNASGTLVADGYYLDSQYNLRYDENNATGVTSTFGDPFLNTNNAPANNQNMELEFAASATNNTPAGTYSADLSLIAVGKF